MLRIILAQGPHSSSLHRPNYSVNAAKVSIIILLNTKTFCPKCAQQVCPQDALTQQSLL